MTARKDRVGEVHGRLTVLEEGDQKRYPSGQKQRSWKCRCECGNEVEVTTANLGSTKSCGCLRREQAKALMGVRHMCGDKNPNRIAAKIKHGALYSSSKDQWYIRAYLIHNKCRKEGIEFGFAGPHEFAAYLRSVAPATCPVFGTPFDKRVKSLNASVDRINPQLGYTRENIQIISFLANAMKRNASTDQLRAFAEWVLRSQHEQT